MADTADKNMIDKDEYPQTAEIERRCVNMIGRLWHAPGDGDVTGTSTTGSSEAAMLGGMALKWRWRERMRAAGKPTDKPEPGDGRQRPGLLGQVLPLLGRRAAARADGGRPLPPDRRRGARALRREHDRRRRDPRLDLRRQLRAGQGDLHRARPAGRPAAGPTSRSTSTRHRAASSRRSCSPTWSGTSTSTACSRSTRRGTSTGSSIPASAGRSGATPRRCRATSSSTSTTWAGRCRRSRSTSRGRAAR